MRVILFSHHYEKLWGQTSAKLLAVNTDIYIHRPFDVSELGSLVDYDTRYYDQSEWVMKRGTIAKGEYMQLVLLGNKGIPFCALRRQNVENRKRYIGKEGETFLIGVTEETRQEV
jgi:hypothetical protein